MKEIHFTDAILEDYLEAFSCAIQQLYDAYMDLGIYAEEQYKGGMQKLVEDVPHNQDYYGAAEMIQWCYHNFKIDFEDLKNIVAEHSDFYEANSENPKDTLPKGGLS